MNCPNMIGTYFKNESIRDNGDDIFISKYWDIYCMEPVKYYWNFTYFTSCGESDYYILSFPHV